MDSFERKGTYLSQLWKMRIQNQMPNGSVSKHSSLPDSQAVSSDFILTTEKSRVFSKLSSVRILIPFTKLPSVWPNHFTRSSTQSFVISTFLKTEMFPSEKKRRITSERIKT